MFKQNKFTNRYWRRAVFTLILALVLMFVLALPALAITYGEPDGDDHPFVGTIVVAVPGYELRQLCSGTLIADDVFLTAAHCTVYLDAIVASNPDAGVFVSFDPTISEDATFYTGNWITNPSFNGYQGPGGVSDPGDIAVIILDEAPGIVPASLPYAGMLDDMKANKSLKDSRYTVVGYGAIRESNTHGFAGILENVDRNRAEHGFLSLTKAWLTFPMTINTGNGGTCYGDSAAPHLLHVNGLETNTVVGITAWGDAPCVALDKAYRLDTPSARNFLGIYVTLP
jgi:secreted trypsin-like serine protease